MDGEEVIIGIKKKVVLIGNILVRCQDRRKILNSGEPFLPDDYLGEMTTEIVLDCVEMVTINHFV